MTKVLKRLFCALICLGAVGLFLDNDAWLYTNPIGEIVHTTSKNKQSVTDEHGNTDELFVQQVTIRRVSGARETLTVTNQTNASETASQIYRRGQKVILEYHADTNSWRILSLKRDVVLGLLVTLLILVVYWYSPFRSANWLLLSLLVNLGLFSLATYGDVALTNPNVIALFTGLALALAVVSLYFVLRHRRQMLVTLAATLVSTSLAVLIMLVTLALTQGQGVHFETMGYVTQQPESLFIAQTIIGVLGAVMDESADIVAGIFGVQHEHGQRSWRQYWKNGLSIGRDIMGTLVNVLFMIFIADTLPIVFLMLRNGNHWTYIMGMEMNLGILQTVVSGIGIVLAVPVTSALTAWVLQTKKERSA